MEYKFEWANQTVRASTNPQAKDKRLELLKQRLQQDIRTPLYEMCIKVFKSPHNAIRIILSVYVCLAICLASYTIIESILAYFTYQVITTSRTLHETPTLYPKVTICSSHIFQTGYALELLKKANTRLYPHVDVLNLTQMKEFPLNAKLSMIEHIHTLASGQVNEKSFSNENRKKLSHALSDILLKCKYNYQPCTPADFLWTFDANYGNCYIFNSGVNASTGQPIGLQYANTAGSLFGLQLDIYVNFNESLKYFRARGTGKGLLIRIDNSSYLTDHSIDGVKVSGGLQTDIVIDRAFKTALPRPYSDCVVDESSKTSKSQSYSDLYSLIAHSSYAYTQQLCFTQCFQKAVIRTCNCSAGVFASLFSASSPLCTTLSEVSCYQSVAINVYSANEYIDTNCKPVCPLECSSTRYVPSLSSIEFDGDLYVDYLQQNQNLSADFANQPVNAAEASSGIASVNIFYDSLSCKYTTESSKMDVVAMFASIGGNLGLFVGISLLSVCELVEICIDFSLIKFRERVHS